MKLDASTMLWLTVNLILAIRNVASQSANNIDLLDRFLAPNCPANSFDCGEKCIQLNRFHDCQVDCHNGIDEECWPGMVKCDGCRCVDPRDADAICIDRSGFNQKLCRTQQRTIYKCANDNCVLFKWTLDGRNDCGDWSDENPCRLGLKKCPKGMRCRFIAPTTTECECIFITDTFNGTHCIPASTQSPPASTSREPIGPTTVIPVPPKCATAVPSGVNVSLAGAPISLIYVLDTGVRMAPDKEMIVKGTSEHVFRVVRDQPNRFKSYVLAPFREIAQPLSNTASPLLFLQSLQQQRFESGGACAKPLLASLQRAIMLAEERSIAFVFTDGSANDLNLLENVMALATLKSIQVNIILTDEACECICRENELAVDSLDAFMRLATVSHGSLVQMAKSQEEYSGLFQVKSVQLQSLHLLLARNEAEVSIPVDSGLNLIYGTVTGQKLSAQMQSEIPATILLTTSNLQVFSAVPYVSTEVTVTASAEGPATVELSALGWPEFSYGFSWNPFDSSPVIRERPWFGLPEYMLISHQPAGLVDLTLTTIIITETENEQSVFSGVPLLYENSENYQWIAGPFNPTCEYFDITVTGENACGEKFQRLSRTAIRAFEANLGNRLPGTCEPNSFDCGNSVCVDANSYRNCKADCPDAIDEARPMDVYHCSGRFTGCSTFSNSSYMPLSQWCLKPYVFKCDNHYCIPYQWVNDGSDDCGDGSDERANTQTPRTTTFATTEIPVASTTVKYYNQTLVPPPSEFDLYTALFENSCPAKGGPYFECGTGDCIPLEQFRDCRFNCEDGTDEVCPNGMVKCGSCKCGLPSEQKTDCIDREVQALCDRRNMYPCEKDQFCTLMSKLLDGVKNCPDGSDEDPSYLDECYLGRDRCSTHATCSNLLGGSYRCLCKFGYFGNGTHCELPHT